MTDIRKTLESLADAIEEVQNKPAQKPQILDRELTGNKIHGGIITKFASVGIVDEAKQRILVVKDDGIHVTAVHADTIAVKNLTGPVAISGDVTVDGALTVKKLHVDELTADVRNERTDPLAFLGKGNNTAYGKGLVWPGGEYTKQFLLMERPDRFFATESLELRANKIYMINGQNVLSQEALGTTVTKSNLKTLGSLESLVVDGHVSIDNYIYYDANSQRLGIGTDAPNGAVSLKSWDHEFVIDPTDDKRFKLGTYTTSGLDIITDDTPRITVDAGGAVTIHNKLVIKDKLGVGVKNFATDADITTAGPIRMQGKKFEVDNSYPESGSYALGDIVWNDKPKPTGYVGWICVRAGTPGEWKPFGQISA